MSMLYTLFYHGSETKEKNNNNKKRKKNIYKAYSPTHRPSHPSPAPLGLSPRTIKDPTACGADLRLHGQDTIVLALLGHACRGVVLANPVRAGADHLVRHRGDGTIQRAEIKGEVLDASDTITEPNPKLLRGAWAHLDTRAPLGPGWLLAMIGKRSKGQKKRGRMSYQETWQVSERAPLVTDN